MAARLTRITLANPICGSRSRRRRMAQEPSGDLASLLDALSEARDALRRAEHYACASCSSADMAQSALAEADALIDGAGVGLDHPVADALLSIWRIRRTHTSGTLAGSEDPQNALDSIAAIGNATAEPLVTAAALWHVTDLHQILGDEVSVDAALAGLTAAIEQAEVTVGLSEGVRAWIGALGAEVRARRVYRLARQVMADGLAPDHACSGTSRGGNPEPWQASGLRVYPNKWRREGSAGYEPDAGRQALGVMRDAR